MSTQNNSTTPYTYLIKHNPSGKFYYGVRFAQGCDPKDLFKTYFTSSKVIHSLIKSDGVESFNVEIRKTFETPKDAQSWEIRVLKKLKIPENVNFLNKGVCSPPSHRGILKSTEHKKKISKSNKGKHKAVYALMASRAARKANLGRKRPDHSKFLKQFWKDNPHKKIVKKGSDSPLFGKTKTDECKKKISNSCKARPLVCCINCHRSELVFGGIWTCHFFNHHRNCNG